MEERRQVGRLIVEVVSTELELEWVLLAPGSLELVTLPGV